MENIPKIRFLYTFKGSGNVYGPIYASSEKEAKASIRKQWELKRSNSIEVWEQTQAEADQIQQANREFFNKLQGQATHVCALDFM